MTTEPSDESVERVLRACAAELAEFFYPANPPYRSKEAMAEDMTLVLARHFRALAPARDGWVLMPLEPTEAMRKAYRGALKNYIDALPPEKRYPGSPDCNIRPMLKMLLRYRAMIAAAPSPGGAERE